MFEDSSKSSSILPQRGNVYSTNKGKNYAHSHLVIRNGNKTSTKDAMIQISNAHHLPTPTCLLVLHQHVILKAHWNGTLCARQCYNQRVHSSYSEYALICHIRNTESILMASKGSALGCQYFESDGISLAIKETQCLCRASVSKLETLCVLVRNRKYTLNILTDAGEIRIIIIYANISSNITRDRKRALSHIQTANTHTGIKPSYVLWLVYYY